MATIYAGRKVKGMKMKMAGEDIRINPVGKSMLILTQWGTIKDHRAHQAHTSLSQRQGAPNVDRSAVAWRGVAWRGWVPLGGAGWWAAVLP